MKLSLQKKLAAKVAKTGKSRVKLLPESLEELKTAITKADIRALISSGVIRVVKSMGVSRHRARKKHIQKKKGRRRGYGSRKGTAKARSDPKRQWINRIRVQRRTLKELKLKGKISTQDYRKMMLKAKGGFFRSKKHLLQYLKQHEIIK